MLKCNNSISSLLELKHEREFKSNNLLAEKYILVHAHARQLHEILEQGQKTYRFLVTQ